MYSYPAGTIINGILTDHRTVRPAMPFTINDVSYGLAHFADAELLVRLGIKSFIEDAVPAHYQGGVPEDVETANTIHRTYPNPILQAEPWRAQLVQATQVKKIAKRDGGFAVNGILFDSDANANIAYLNFGFRLAQEPTFSTPWKASGNIWVTMDAALFTLVSAAFAANNQGAFAWQAQMDAALAAAPDTYAALKAIEDAINEA